jgi:hypothetical protein
MRMTPTKALIAAGLAAAFVAPATASAATTVPVTTTADSVASCTDPQVSPLLAEFGDPRSYFVAPGGDFEDGAAGWQLSGGALLGYGSDGLDIVGGTRSLRLPAGASAVSPSFCVDERFPSFRLTTAQLGLNKANLKVEVIHPGETDNVDKAGKVATAPISAWGLTPDMAIDTQASGWHRIALRFTVDKADFLSDLRVDDVVVDPRLSR